ncbi:MAG TPA: hypothetical protein VGI19_18670 [Candidatus Cybelea sp.]|jgi:hypothetical protein
MLSDLYRQARGECDIEIVFRPTEGQQQNPCRDLMIAYVQSPNVDNGRALASRLQGVTTRRSGLGLFFLAVGDEVDQLLLVSRFPADQGVMADEQGGRLTVSFIERVFMKSAKAYKCAIYPGPAEEGAFWAGRAVDKQVNKEKELSNYWIGDFLASDLSTTGPAGSKRLATAFREAIKASTSPELRDELMAAVRLARGHNGQVITSEGLVERLALSPDARDALKEKMQRPELFAESFRFDREEFDHHIQYRSVELNNGAILTAESVRFDDVFEQTRGPNAVSTTYTTTGAVVNDWLKKIR